MKKRLLSFALAAVMLLSLLPVTAFAAATGLEATAGDIAGTPLGNLIRPLASEGVTVTATADSEEVASVPASGAIDGLISGNYRWASATGSGSHWLQIDLGTQRAVSVIRIYWERDNVIQYNVQGSQDGTNWTQLYAQTARTVGKTTHTIELDAPVKIKYLKVNTTQHQADASAKYDGTTPSSWNAVSIMEVEAFKNAASIPVDSQKVADALTAKIENGKVVLDTAAADRLAGEWEFEYSFAANLEQVVGEDGTIYTPLVNTQVELDATVTRKFDGVTVTTDPSQPIKVIVPGEYTANMGNAKPRVIPELAEWYSSTAQKGKYYTLTSTSKIVAPAELTAVASEVKADIQDLFGFNLDTAASGAAAGDIVLVLDESKAGAGFDNETYLMEVADRVTITATDPTGAYWGTRSALQALKYSGNRTIAQGAARDYPEFKVRGFVMDVGRKPVSMDTLRNIVKNMSWYKLNDFHIHLNDNLIFLEDYISGWQANQPTTAEDYAKANNAYAAFRLESDIQPEQGGNNLAAKDYAYTKTEFKSFIGDSAALGVNIVPEIDAPAHAKSITDAFPSLRLYNASGMRSHPYNDHLDLSEGKYSQSLQVVENIFDEYIDSHTFGSIVHFGADEYYDNHAAYRRFFLDMVDHLKEKGVTPRVWGSLSSMSGGTTNGQSYDVPANSRYTKGVQMNIWSTGWANPQAMYNMGFDLINVTDGPFYMVPNGGGGRGAYGDYLNLTALYAKSPNQIGDTWFPASSSQILGESFAMWNDNIDTRASGLDEVDLFDRFFDSLPVAAVRMWGEGDKLDRTLAELQTDAAITGTAPNTNPYFERTTSAELPSYDFSSSAGLTTTNADVADGALTLKGGTSYAETGMDRLGWGSTLSFRIKVTSISSEGVIFECDPAYGDYAIKALPVEGKTDKWKLGFSRELYDYEFATELPVGQWVTLTIKNSKQSTKLSVDGGAEAAAVGKFVAKADSNNEFIGKTGITHSSFEIPVARIGSKTNSFVGQIDDVAINSPIKEEPERPQDDGTQLINLALNKPVTVSGNGTCIANNNKPSSPAPENAVDGAIEEFEDYAWIGADMTTNRVDGRQNPPQWLVVDLGENIAEINNLKPEMINIAYGRRSWATKFDIQTADSTNGPWTSLLTETVNRNHAWGYIPSTYPNRWSGISYGDSFTTAGGSDDITLKEDAVLKRYVRLYVTEVNAANGSDTNIGGNNGQCKSVAVTEFQVFARLPQTESAENIRAYQIAGNQVWLTWDQVGTTYYQVYAKAPGGSWECISGGDAVNGNVFIHTGYTEGTVYRVLTPGSEVTSPVNTNTSAVDIRETGENGYILNTVTDRISYSEGWGNWANEPQNTYIGPSVTYCNSPTESLTAELVFMGSGIQLIGGMKNNGGQMTVEIDGVPVGTADYDNGGSAMHQQVIFEQIGLDYGVHTIRLTGVSNTGTVEIEAFRVLVPAESITLSATGLADGRLTISTGGSATNVTATVTPANNSGEFVWTSGSPATATVTGETRPDAQGRMIATITPVAGGSATITVADRNDPTLKAELALTVNQSVASVTLPDNQHSIILYLNPGANQHSAATLTPRVLPETATDKTVTYTSNNTGVATVDASGNITAVAAGTARITVTAGGKTDTCLVTVKSNPTGITIKDGQNEITEGAPLVLYTNKQADLSDGRRNSAALTAVLAPTDVTETNLTWDYADELAEELISVGQSSTNPTRCTISVTGISENNVGERIIEVKSVSNEAITATFKVRVLRYLIHDVTISVLQNQSPRPGATLEADINRLNLEDTGVSGLTYQWYRDGTPITGATDPTYVLTGDDIGAAISVTVSATPTDTYFYEGERTSTNTVTVWKNAPPVPPVLTATPMDGGTKGTITISNPVSDTAYEISSDGGRTWTDATVVDGVIGDLEEGSYQVRLKATDTHDAGRPATITVTDITKTYFTASYTISPAESGAVLLDKTSVVEDGSVSATVTPNPGYDIENVTVDGEELEGTAQDDGSMVYTVEDVAGNVEFVVTLAKRQLTITHLLTNGLKCSKATSGQDSHLVEYGTSEVITLVAEEGYTLPAGSDIEIKRDDGTIFTAFTYSQRTGIITITGGVTENLTITAAGVVKTYQVAYTNMRNVTGPDEADARIATHGQDYTATLTAVTGYMLPATITVKRGDTTLVAGTDYIYNPTTGAVVIKASAVTGNLSISATGERGLTPLEAVSISGIAQVNQELTAQVSPEAAAYDVNYQWIWVDDEGNETVIEGVTGMTQIITELSLGKRIAVRVTPDDDSTYTGSATSQPTAVVIAANAPTIPVSKVDVSPTAATIVMGSTTTLTAAVRPANATNQTVIWSSDNEDVASVDSVGVVTGVSVGTATITVTTEDGECTAACTVTVTARPVVNPPQQGPIGGGILTPPTTTTVVENPDGSTTTTVTDNRTGTVTETTEMPDGSTETVETKKDGTVTATTENPDGSTEVVETKPDGTVTATSTDAEGGKVEKVITPDEDVTITVTDPEGETLAKVEIPAEIPASPIKFVDVPEGHWAESAINQAAGLGLVNGVGDDQFNWNGDMERGDLALVLYRLSSKVSTDNDVTFDDVPAGAYYADGVAWAVATGVVKGYSETEFGPKDNITREELAVMLYRYAKLLKLDTAASADALDAFNDGSNTSSWAEDGMAWCVENGIIKGKGSDTLDPGANASRAEVTVMLQRFMALMK